MESDQLRLSGELVRLVAGYQVAQTIYAAASLGIADLLRDETQSSAALASASATDGSSLFRLLRALVSIGLLDEVTPDCFKLTPLGSCLRSDSASRGRSLALWLGGENMWRTWGDLLHCIRTGESAFSHVFGTDNVFDYYAAHPELEEITSAGFAALTFYFAAAVVEAYDFSKFGAVADVGGGRGALLATILEKNPKLRGILFDLPHVARASATLLEEAGVTSRCEITAGDMFKSVPGGADAYILSRVIHDWDDERSKVILGNCRAAMPSTAKLLLVERVLPDLAARSPGNQGRFLADINMLVRTGGRERTAEEFRVLLAAAKFELVRVVSTSTEISVVEAEPRACDDAI